MAINPTIVNYDAISKILKDVNRKDLEKIKSEAKQSIVKNVSDWDVKITDEILYFDSELSYELTGYKPITKTKGLDFDPEWFIQARRTKESTGKYCDAPFNTKPYREFWNEEYRRCRNGYSSHGYTITGDNYFFINYYQLLTVDKVTKAGGGRTEGFASFYVKQYEYFHYIELCKRLRRNAIGLKSRSVGFSEIGANICTNTYNCIPKSHCVIAAEKSDYVEKTLAKCWTQLDYMNIETEGGFKKLRQVKNTAMNKKASVLVGRDEKGWGSDILGVIADTPNKIRGDRTDVLIYEEAGSWGSFKKAFIQGEALVYVQGKKVGIQMAWGTGGDSGPQLEGLADAFYNPDSYDGLPYKHNYTENGESVVTGYFIPAYTIVALPEFIDKRGWTDPDKAKEYYIQQRNKKIGDPKALLLYSAEYCFTPEEALALEGENEFDTILLSEQLANITLHKIEPPQGKIQTGRLEYIFKENTERKVTNYTGFRWIEDNNSKIHILEHPIKIEDADYKNLYVAGIDGIDLGMNETSENTRDPSEFCVVIKKRAFGLQEPQYVAYYKDRPNDIDDAYRTTLKLLQYYNCQAVLESSKISILTWFRSRNVANKYLMKRPRACLSDINKGKTSLFGAQTTDVIIQHQLDLIRTYIRDYSHNIWFKELLEELIKYSYKNKRKFDMVAALGMAELGDEEMQGLSIKETNVSDKTQLLIGYWTDDQGIKHYGIIPNKEIIPPTYNFSNEYIGTSNYRYNM